MTTLIFLSRGVKEGNPLVIHALPFAHSPWMGLIAVKLLATLIGFYCYRRGRMHVLRLANAGYLLIVGWNLTAIAASIAQTPHM